MHIVIVNYHGIISIEPGKCSGKPCMQGFDAGSATAI
jgi:uncharacterized protein (DUF433 family)